MTTVREAAQMALDALITAEREGNCEYGATDALRARLAQPIQPDWSKAGFGQPQQPEPEKSLSQRMREAGFTPRDTRLECDGCGKKFSRLMLPIHDCDAAQPEQEPVAWRIRCTDPMRDWVLMYRHPKTEDQFSNMEIQPLYTAPPQREWQGMTDEEIKTVYDSAKTTDTYVFIRAIEAALRSKNT